MTIKNLLTLSLFIFLPLQVAAQSSFDDFWAADLYLKCDDPPHTVNLGAGRRITLDGIEVEITNSDYAKNPDGTQDKTRVEAEVKKANGTTVVKVFSFDRGVLVANNP